MGAKGEVSPQAVVHQGCVPHVGDTGKYPPGRLAGAMRLGGVWPAFTQATAGQSLARLGET